MYVCPIARSSLAAMTIRSNHLQSLEAFHKKIIRGFMNLSPSSPIPALYFLMPPLGSLKAKRHTHNAQPHKRNAVRADGAEQHITTHPSILWLARVTRKIKDPDPRPMFLKKSVAGNYCHPVYHRDGIEHGQF